MNRLRKVLQRFVVDDRGISTVMNYTLALGVTAILITGIITGTVGFVESKSESTARTQLDVSSSTVVSEITTVRSIAASPREENQEVTTTVSLPDRTTAGTYLITVTDSNVTFATIDGDVSVTKELPERGGSISTTSNGRISGGDVEIRYRGGDTIEVVSDA